MPFKPPIVDRLGQWGRATSNPSLGREILAECLLCGWAHVYDRPEEMFTGWGAHLEERHPRRSANIRRWSEWERRPAFLDMGINDEHPRTIRIACPACSDWSDEQVFDLARARAAFNLHAFDYHPRRLARHTAHRLGHVHRT